MKLLKSRWSSGRTEARNENEYYKSLAEKLIDSMKELEYIKDSHVKIAYLESNISKKSGSNFVYGECEKVQAKYKWRIPEDFTITIYKNNITHFTEEQIAILLFHELLHIGVDVIEDMYDETQRIEKYSIVKHDLNDFKTIVEKYGVDWDKTIQLYKGSEQ